MIEANDDDLIHALNQFDPKRPVAPSAKRIRHRLRQRRQRRIAAGSVLILAGVVTATWFSFADTFQEMTPQNLVQKPLILEPTQPLVTNPSPAPEEIYSDSKEILAAVSKTFENIPTESRIRIRKGPQGSFRVLASTSIPLDSVSEHLERILTLARSANLERKGGVWSGGIIL
jgi:hypothetical protein